MLINYIKMLRASKYNRRMEFQIIMGLFVINLTTSTWIRYVYIILSESVLPVLKFEINVDHNYTNGTSPSQKDIKWQNSYPQLLYTYMYIVVDKLCKVMKVSLNSNEHHLLDSDDLSPQT